MQLPDSQRDDPEALARHQAYIIAWLWGYRQGRSIQSLNPGWPQGNGWLVVAQFCQLFMREHFKVICTIREILETFDEHLADVKRHIPATERIAASVFDLSGDYETIAQARATLIQ